MRIFFHTARYPREAGWTGAELWLIWRWGDQKMNERDKETTVGRNAFANIAAMELALPCLKTSQVCLDWP